MIHSSVKSLPSRGVIDLDSYFYFRVRQKIIFVEETICLPAIRCESKKYDKNFEKWLMSNDC